MLLKYIKHPKGIKDNKKYFRKYKIELELIPKNPSKYIVANNDYDIGEIYKRHSSGINIHPFIKNDTIYYEVIDTQNIHVYCFAYTDKHYEYKQGSKIIKEKIKENDIKYFWEDKQEKFESMFIHTRHFNYIKDIEWTVD